MNKSEYIKLYNKALNSIKEGDYNTALYITDQINKMGGFSFYFSSGLYIDIGCELKKEEIVKKGINLLELNLKKIDKEKDRIYAN